MFEIEDSYILRNYNFLDESQMNWRKCFLGVGIPLFAFFLFVINIYFAFISGVLIIFLLTGLTTIRRDHIWERLTKLSAACFLLFILLVSNPLIWPDQFSRHINSDRIITPNNSAVTGLNDTDEIWSWMNTQQGLTIEQFEQLNDPEKLDLIEQYFLDIIEWIEIHYQYGVLKRLATPEEAITSSQGDCQAQTCAMVSFLIYMGYNAYAAETPMHWYAVVYLSDGTEVFLYRIIDDGFRCSDPEVLIGDDEVLYTMKTPQLLWDIIVDDHMNENMFFPAIEQIGTFFAFLAIFGVFGAIIALMEIRIRTQEPKEIGQYLKKPLLAGMLTMMVGVILARIVPIFVPRAFTAVLLITILIAVKLVQNCID